MFPNSFDLVPTLRPPGMLAATAGGCSFFPWYTSGELLPLLPPLTTEVKEDPFAQACDVNWLAGGERFTTFDGQYPFALDSCADYLYLVRCVEPEQNRGPHIPRRPHDPHARRPLERYEMKTI